MKLKRIEFKNFKSIKDDSLTITHNCMVLVGKNEAGKSNILKGIAGGISDKAHHLSKNYKRKKTSDEFVSEYQIDFLFELDINEIDVFEAYIKELINGNFFNLGDKPITNREFIEKFCNLGIFRCDLERNTRNALCYQFPKEIKLNTSIIKLSDPYNDIKTGVIIAKPNGDVVNGTEQNLEHILSIFSNYLTQYITNHLPKVYYWEKEEKYLLPPSVSLSGFQNNPTSVIPLKTLFNLAGYDDIPKTFNDAIAENGDLLNLLQNVGEKATTVFRTKWPDLKGISFYLNKDGDSLLIKIKEKMNYNMEERSDGFKHFVSILLALSSNVELKQINNAIILIDEPDRSLYPNAAKYLRDELIKLSQNNIVIYATHSPFMIDNNIYSRHVIVSKEKEITSISPVADEDESYQKDDVLLTAIGTSRFESIKENNIIFEGWSDYNFLKEALKTNKKEYKNIKNFFKPVGMTFVHGVSSIKHLTPILQLTNRNIFIVSDADEAAQKAKTSYIKDSGYQYQNWFTFKDLGIQDKFTIEDFIIDEDIFQKTLIEMNKQSADFSQRSNKGILGCIADLLNKEEKRTFKNLVATKLTTDKIDPSYYQLLEKLKNKIENATENN